MALAEMKITIKPKDIANRFKKFAKVFPKEADKAHRVAVFSVLGQVIRWTRVDTGRLRAAWLPFLDTYGVDYRAFMISYPTVKPDEEHLGRSEGTWEDFPFHTRILNNVKYAEHVDKKVGIFVTGTFLSRYPYFERIYSEKIKEFFDAADELLEGKTPRVEVRPPQL